jgi:transglutaminase-like putative cysteine protease
VSGGALALHLQRVARWRQWPRERRDTLFQLAVIGWTIAPHFTHLAPWCVLLTSAVLLWRAQLALVDGALPPRWMLLALMVAAAALTWTSERTLLGRDAGVTMLVVLMGLKTLELRARRDALVVFFLGFFLALTQCLYSQSILTALGMLVATWGLLTAQVLANMPVGRPALARAGAVAARSALIGLPVMAVLFVLFPRIGPLWGLPQDAMGRTGLSGTLRMGGVAELARDDTIAFRVRFDDRLPPPPEALYFRGPVLSRFDGLEWTPSLDGGSRGPRVAPELRPHGTPVRYEMIVEPIRLALLPLLEATPRPPLLLSAQGGLAPWQGPDMQWHTERALTERLRLQAQAWPRFELGPSTAAAPLADDLALPPHANPRTLAWARQTRLALASSDARTLAAAVLAYIRQEPFVYTLQPGDYGANAVDEFWFERRQGFCEHYATAFVVVMRAMGVPARVVTGYQGAEPPDADGWRVVRQSHAHAWAEYWQSGSGWLRADPTSAVAPERVQLSRALLPPPGIVADALATVSPALAERLRRAWELLDNRWNQWVMGYSRTSQFDLLATLGVREPDGSDLVRLLVAIITLAASAGAAWAWWDRRRQDPWQRLHGRIVAALQRAGVPAKPHHPPRTLAALLRARHGEAGEAAAAALEALDRERYGAGGQRMPTPAWWLEFARKLRGLARQPPPRPVASPAS